MKLQGLQGAAGRLCERSATTTETAANPSWIRQVPSLQPCKGCAGRREVDNGNTRPALRRASLGFPIILSVVMHGRGCVVIVVSRDVEGRDEDRHRDLVPGTRAVAMCLGPETASGALNVRDPESESGRGCQ